jgi:hypothetical protein
MELHSVKFIDAPQIAHLQAFLSRQLTAIDSCPDSEFESRFNIFVIDFEEMFRSRKRSESDGFGDGEAVRAMYKESIDILRHTLARISSNDIYFARKIIFLLSHRFLEKSPSDSASLS